MSGLPGRDIGQIVAAKSAEALANDALANDERTEVADRY